MAALLVDMERSGGEMMGVSHFFRDMIRHSFLPPPHPSHPLIISFLENVLLLQHLGRLVDELRQSPPLSKISLRLLSRIVQPFSFDSSIRLLAPNAHPTAPTSLLPNHSDIVNDTPLINTFTHIHNSQCGAHDSRKRFHLYARLRRRLDLH